MTIDQLIFFIKRHLNSPENHMAASDLMQDWYKERSVQGVKDVCQKLEYSEMEMLIRTTIKREWYEISKAIQIVMLERKNENV